MANEPHATANETAGFTAGVVPPVGELPPESLAFVVTGERILVRSSPAGIPSLGEAGEVEGDRLYLGMLGDLACVAIHAASPAEMPGLEPRSLWALHELVTETHFAIAGRAVQIARWVATHRFCGQCGHETEALPGERAMRCPSCGLLAYPRLSPAIIVRVTRGRDILLAHNRQANVPIYSVLAGFVEPGESLEQAVAREIREEVGIEVSAVRYFASQPWPFPHSLMVGFTAEWSHEEISIDEAELTHAAWFAPEELPVLPPRLSIARQLIDDHISRVAPNVTTRTGRIPNG